MQSRLVSLASDETASVSDKNAERVRPWMVRPFQLVSWYDMQKFGAEKYFAIARGLEHLVVIFQNRAIVDEPFEAKPQWNDMFCAIRDRCAECGLSVSSDLLTQFADEINDINSRMTFGDVSSRMDHIGRTITTEMKQAVFMYIPADRAERYDQQELFGAEVASVFTSASFDIRESGNCYAAGRYTACVFHLMRVLEIGLLTFAREFPSVPTDRENWQQIIEKIEAEIRTMPKAQTKPVDWKQKHEKYSQTANSFMFFKDAWRNYTAHARGKYVEDEADMIFRNVGSFMRQLAEGGLHE